MAAKRILLLDGPALTAYYWHSGRIKTEGEFSHEPVGLEALAAYLKKHRSSLFYVLADIAEEGFQLEDLPYVQGADRSALLQRRLSQYYYNTPLSAAISLGRATEGRRDEKLLFAALTRVETFTPWLDTLREAEAILAGVYSVPLVLASCGPQVLGDKDPVLFVSLTRGGVRQSFFDQGKLHFSRLSQLATRSLDEIGRTSAADSAKIFQYLLAQRQIPRGTALRTVILAHAGQIPTLQRFCSNTSDLQFEFADIADMARLQGLKDVPGDSNADNLFIHCLATKTPVQQFAPANERRFYRLWQIRFALTSAAWIVLAGCLLFAGKTSLNLYELADTINATKAVTATDNQRYNSILEGLPKISVTADNLRALIGRFEALQKRTPAIEPLLLHLSLALNDAPRIELTHLTWKTSDRPDPSQKIAEDPKRGPGAAPVVDAAAGNWAVIEIQAQLPLALIADQRAQIELIENFAARLSDPKTNVKVLSRPFDIESDKPLKSTGQRGDAQPSDVPKFALRIARQL
ncbi:MAG: hypothetical protein A3H93_01600 [Rhodocyclales bacterium RIFCSPLOWO2_02_FULL_63_24]|nr:MAG: hypothetical protein A2040_17050 [Rhodocyclales bacterium GWA2_65_19]OHC70105.1 MAG: hypothetical protein A3H93_01600 [Rhodocyclales bacterium RIFCSPLOWO2_02_FULL_63_24]